MGSLPLGLLYWWAGGCIEMNRGAQRRLAGTTVIVLLVVIFLPMLVEEPVEPSKQEAPSPQFDESFQPPPSEPVETISTVPELPEPEDYEAMPKAAEPSSAQPESQPTEPEPATPDPAPVTPDPMPAASPAPAPAQTAWQGPGWVLQVSSLREKARATSLQQRLQEAGFPVFLEEAEVRGQRYHRVRIGPRSTKAQIKSLAAEVQARTGYEGQILRYSP